MKKFLYSSLIALAGIFAVSSCETVNEKVIFNPEEVTAPTVGELAGGVLAKDGADIVLEFGAADFKIDVANSYELQASQTEDFAAVVNVTAAITDSTATVKQSDINSMILNFGVAPETETVVYFRLMSFLINEKNIAVVGSETYSNVISAKFTPYNAVVPEKDTYAHVWVIGDYCGWDHGKTQFLYNYTGDKTTYSGIVDFADKAANGWKLTGVAGWDDTCNWGSEAQAEEAEQSTIQLITGGGSKDIKAYSKRFYHFEFNTSSLVLKKSFGFDQVGVIGLNGDWENDIVLNYNPVLVRFYADIEATSATEMKFRADADWGLNWGVDLAQGGGNIPVAAGKYRVYLDLNKNEFKLDASMFGKPETGVDDVVEEPTPEPEPTPANVGWGVIGVAGNWDVDIPMTESNGVWSAYVTLGEAESFKFRKDGAWDENFGGVFAAVDTPFEAVAGGANIEGVPAGFYKMILDTVNKTITISAGDVWSLIGQINGSNWDKDVIMTKDGDKWVSPVVTIDGEFKIRHNLDWTLSYGLAAGVEVKLDEALKATSDNGGNIKLAAGDYKVTLDLAAETILITQPAFPETLYMIGDEFGGWNWDDAGVVAMNPVASDNGVGQFWAIRYITAGKGFKFNSKKAWGGDFHSLTTNDGYTEAGGNCTVAEDGLYMIHVDFKREMVHVEKARVYGIGDGFGGWNEGMEAALFATDGKTVKATLAADAEIRMYAASSISNSDWWTREFIFFDGKIAYRGNGGDQERVKGTAGQVITLDFNAGTATLL